MATVLELMKLIRTEAEYEAALEAIEQLWDADPDSPDGQMLQVLALLVETYERERYPIDPPSPIDAILFRMEQAGLRQVDLAPYLGGRNRVSEVLKGDRALTVNMIRQLHEGLGIPPESLLG